MVVEKKDLSRIRKFFDNETFQTGKYHGLNFSAFVRNAMRSVLSDSNKMKIAITEIKEQYKTDNAK